MGLIDTHCHLDDPSFVVDFPAMIERARAASVTGLVAVGTAPASWPTQIVRARQARMAGISTGVALGIHPWWAEQVDDEGFACLQNWLEDSDAFGCPSDWLVAIGEIGLDFDREMPDTARQMRLFERQLALAEAHPLPLILHARKSEDRLLWYLRRAGGCRGVVHGFTGSLQQAEAFVELGFAIGIGGSITHPGAHRMHRLVRALPLEAMLLETDAPNQPGHAHRGERNEPAWLSENLQALATLRDEPIERVAEQTQANALALFGARWLLAD